MANIIISTANNEYIELHIMFLFNYTNKYNLLYNLIKENANISLNRQNLKNKIIECKDIYINMLNNDADKNFKIEYNELCNCAYNVIITFYKNYDTALQEFLINLYQIDATIFVEYYLYNTNENNNYELKTYKTYIK